MRTDADEPSENKLHINFLLSRFSALEIDYELSGEITLSTKKLAMTVLWGRDWNISHEWPVSKKGGLNIYIYYPICMNETSLAARINHFLRCPPPEIWNAGM